MQTELAASHLMFVLHASSFHAVAHWSAVEHAGAATHPLSRVQYWPAEQAVAPVRGPIVDWHLPLTQVSTVQACPSSQLWVQALRVLVPPTPPEEVPPSPAPPPVPLDEQDALPSDIKSAIRENQAVGEALMLKYPHWPWFPRMKTCRPCQMPLPPQPLSLGTGTATIGRSSDGRSPHPPCIQRCRCRSRHDPTNSQSSRHRHKNHQRAIEGRRDWSNRPDRDNRHS